MVKLTIIARVRDGLILAEGLDADKEEGMYLFKGQAKALIRQLSSSKPPPRSSIASGPCTFHVLVQDDVAFVTLCAQAYPKKLAFAYLEELAREFSRLYPPRSVEAARQPYAFVKFDTFIGKTRRLYADARTQRNVARLQADIADVHAIVSRNIADVLSHGERLDRMQAMSATLSADSKAFAGKAKDLYRQALLKKYLPWAVVAGVCLLVFGLVRAFR